MTTTQALNEIEVSLAQRIQAWFDDLTEDNQDAWEVVGWIGDDLHVLMARAAMACLEASVDVQKTMKENGVE